MKRIIGLLAVVTVLFPVAAAAQDRGTTPIGRQGFAWQTDIRNDKEGMKRFETELAAIPLEEWKRRALAWVQLEEGGAEGATLLVEESHRVGGLEAKKVEVRPRGDTGDQWDLVVEKKTPKELTMVLTDQGATRVECPFRAAVDGGAGHLGVFLSDGVLLCLPRAVEPTVGKSRRQ